MPLPEKKTCGGPCGEVLPVGAFTSRRAGGATKLSELNHACTRCRTMTTRLATRQRRARSLSQAQLDEEIYRARELLDVLTAEQSVRVFTTTEAGHELGHAGVPPNGVVPQDGEPAR